MWLSGALELTPLPHRSSSWYVHHVKNNMEHIKLSGECILEGGFHFQTEALEAQQIHQVGAFFALSGYVAAPCSVDLAAPAAPACPK